MIQDIAVEGGREEPKAVSRKSDHGGAIELGSASGRILTAAEANKGKADSRTASSIQCHASSCGLYP